jgi:DNA-binding CsgD family transcriptional regulator
MNLNPTAAGVNPLRALPLGWAAICAEIVDRLEDSALPALLVRALGTLIAFDDCHQFVFRKNNNPIHIYQTPEIPHNSIGLRNYIDGTYVLNPLYKKYHLGRLSTGAYRLRDLASDYFCSVKDEGKYRIAPKASEELGYLTEGWPPGRQELGIALEMPWGECAEITLARKRSDGAFSADDIALITSVVPFLGAVFRRHWCRIRNTRLPNADQPDVAVEVDLPGASRLSPRERQVAQLQLRGHSALSISLQLNISPTTVKTHRKNLYAKLGIATQFELFSLLLKSRQSAPRS